MTKVYNPTPIDLNKFDSIFWDEAAENKIDTFRNIKRLDYKNRISFLGCIPSKKDLTYTRVMVLLGGELLKIALRQENKNEANTFISIQMDPITENVLYEYDTRYFISPSSFLDFYTVPYLAPFADLLRKQKSLHIEDVSLKSIWKTDISKDENNDFKIAIPFLVPDSEDAITEVEIRRQMDDINVIDVRTFRIFTYRDIRQKPKVLRTMQFKPITHYSDEIGWGSGDNLFS